jgi:hypothetical protein
VAIPVEEGDQVSDQQDDDAGSTRGMRAVFWLWMGVIVAGLVVMIAVPLTAR